MANFGEDTSPFVEKAAWNLHLQVDFDRAGIAEDGWETYGSVPTLNTMKVTARSAW